MICQDCKKNNAQVHFTQIVNNEKMSLSLCKECAAARGFHSPLDNVPFPLAEILSSLTTSQPEKSLTKDLEKLKCESCGLTFGDFTRKGRFGCGQCYRTFRHRLEGIMRKIHGASLHRGSIPKFEGEAAENLPIPIKEEERLETELRKAIESEDFERAAEIRDKLRLMKDEANRLAKAEKTKV
jgi:protein arginine kinase activator